MLARDLVCISQWLHKLDRGVSSISGHVAIDYILSVSHCLLPYLEEKVISAHSSEELNNSKYCLRSLKEKIPARKIFCQISKK